MAQTVSVLSTITDQGRGEGFEKQRVVWDAGTLTGVLTPSTASKIHTVTGLDLVNRSGANAFQAVIDWDPTANKELITVTGTANSTFDAFIRGKVA